MQAKRRIVPPTSSKLGVQLRSCFSNNIYHLKSFEYSPHEIYCRGTLRSQNPKNAYNTINQNIQNIFGDRYTCYLQECPLENSGLGFGNTQDSQQNTPNYYFYLRPNDFAKPQGKSQAKSQLVVSDRQSWIASAISIIVTSLTVLAVGANQRESFNLTDLQRGIPYFLGIASIFIARVMTQYNITKKYKLRFSPPLLLPVLSGFGLLGSLNTNFDAGHSPTTQRQAIFDLAVIPTIAGLIISMFLLFLGNAWHHKKTSQHCHQIVILDAASSANECAGRT